MEENVEILPGGSGLKDLADLDDTELTGVIDSLELLEDRADIVVLDTGAGIHKGVLAFALAADTTILVTTPEPTSVRDAYGVLKSLEGAPPKGKELLLVVNMANSDGEALCVRRLAEELLARWGVRRGFSYPPGGLKAFFLRLSRGFFMEK